LQLSQIAVIAGQQKNYPLEWVNEILLHRLCRLHNALRSKFKNFSSHIGVGFKFMQQWMLQPTASAPVITSMRLEWGQVQFVLQNSRRMPSRKPRRSEEWR
jgi:hypothetical protein